MNVETPPNKRYRAALAPTYREKGENAPKRRAPWSLDEDTILEGAFRGFSAHTSSIGTKPFKK
jgi:hypothetical protein